MRKLSKNASVYAVMAFAALTLLAVTGHAQEPQEAGDPDKYLLLSTSRTGTMEEELNAAGARGYRVAGAQGGETAFGGDEAVVIMRLDPEGRRFRYILLATSRTGTMQEELSAVPPDYELVAMTVFRSTFGGSEAAAILEAELVALGAGVVAAPQPQAGESDAGGAMSEITFEEIDELFGWPGGSLTTLQKEARWNEYQGQCVEWSGEMAGLEETFGEYRITFKQGKVNRYALPNVWIFAPLTMQDVLIDWEPGNTYAYRVTLRSTVAPQGSWTVV